MNQLESNVEGAMTRNRTLTERIGLYIPFYRGYKQKNLRRDEDRAIRGLVANVLENAKLDIKNAQRATVGNLNDMRDGERVYAKVDRYCTDVKKAVNGYSGFHDSVKITESELDQVIAFDAALIDDVEELKAKTEILKNDCDAGDRVGPALKVIERIIDKMIDDFRQRDAVMKGFADAGE